MALKSPLFTENNVTAQNADEVRLMLKGLLGGVTGETSGVAHPDHLEVTERAGSTNMSVDVAAGHIFIEGSRNGAQGTYHLYNDATINVPISASDATNDRIDVVYIRLRDSAYDVGFTGLDDAELLVAEGTPAGAPDVPTITDEDYVELARITVTASSTVVTDSDINDRRILGGVGRIPTCKVARAATQSIPNGSPTQITWDLRRWGPAGMWTSGQTITIPVKGIWRVHTVGSFAGSASGRRHLDLRLNGGYLQRRFWPAVLAVNANNENSAEFRFAAGDQLGAEEFQDSGGALNVTAELSATLVQAEI
jgi:hypothetical protein